MPPTTPPAIGPAADFGCDLAMLCVSELLLAPILEHCVDAQALQDGLIRVHVSSAAQTGHVGFALGSQDRHLRKSPRVSPVRPAVVSQRKGEQSRAYREPRNPYSPSSSHQGQRVEQVAELASQKYLISGRSCGGRKGGSSASVSGAAL